VDEIAVCRLGRVKLDKLPPNRLAAPARYGLGSKATSLERAPEPKRTAMLTAVMQHLEAKVIDDALELFTVLMSTKLLSTAKRRSPGVSLGHGVTGSPGPVRRCRPRLGEKCLRWQPFRSEWPLRGVPTRASRGQRRYALCVNTLIGAFRVIRGPETRRTADALGSYPPP
jgi:hypothetical protein